MHVIKLYDEIRSLPIKRMHRLSTMYFTARTMDNRELYIPGDEIIDALEQLGYILAEEVKGDEDSAYINKYLSIGNQQEDEDGSI